ncbi:MAG: protein kinase, partial [Candidatus Omnitrophica bacterium]|nr:protein kinase [Candidatus Omnitrophota bacterium]
AEHLHSGNNRVFKFCFKADRVRSLKREATLFRILRESVGAHPQIVQVLGTYFDEPPYYIEMEYVPGSHLGEWFAEQGDLPIERRLRIAAQIAEILQVAHNAGIIHRDIKPSNVLAVQDSQNVEELSLKLTDFGIGQVKSPEMLVDMTSPGFTETYSRTELASQSGSRLYMAPEVLIGQPSTVASDIYSLGVLLYQLVVGDLSRPLPPDWRKDIKDPILLEDLDRCLSGECTARFASAREFAENLNRHEERSTRMQRGIEIERRRARLRLMTFAGISVGCVLVLLSFTLGYGLRKAWIAQRETSRELYYSLIDRASRALEVDQHGKARQLLWKCPEEYRNWEWGRMLYLCSRDHKSIGEFPNVLDSFQASPNGRWLAVGAKDGYLRVLEEDTGEEILSVNTSSQPVESVAFNHSSSLLAFRTRSRIDVIHVDTRRTLSSFFPFDGYVGNIAFAPSRDLLAATNTKGTLYLYDLTNGATRTLKTNHRGYILDMAFTPDGENLVTTSADFTTGIYSLSSGEMLGSVIHPSMAPGQAVSIFKNARHFLVCHGVSIEIGFLDPFKFERCFTSLPGVPKDLDISPKSEHLIVGLGNKSTKLIDLNNSQILSISGGINPTNQSVQFSADGQHYWTLEEDRCLRKWPVQPEGKVLWLRGHADAFSCADFSPDGTLVATGSWDNTVSIWDTQTGGQVRMLNAYEKITCVQFNSTQKYLAAGTTEGRIIVWDPSAGTRLFDLFEHKRDIAQIAFHPRKSNLISASLDGSIRIWSLSSQSRILRIDSGHNEVTSMCLDPLRDTIITGGADGGVKEWKIDSGEFVRSLPSHSARVGGILISPDLKNLITAGEDQKTRVFDRRSNEIVGTIDSGCSRPQEIAITSDGSRLFLSERIWDLQTLREISIIPEGAKSLSPDNRLLISSNNHIYLGIIPTFPWRKSDLDSQNSLGWESCFEAYKRSFWRKAPPPAGPISLPTPPPPQPDAVTGHWNFDQGDLRATIGRDMEFFDHRQIGGTAAKTSFGSTEDFGMPTINGQTAHVMGFASLGIEEGYRLFTDTTASHGGKSRVNSYTLIMDVLYPDSSAGKRRVLFNTNPNNFNPGDFLISKTDGLGIEGEYSGAVTPERWHRIACVVHLPDKPTMVKYIDGVRVGTQILPEGIDGRWGAFEGKRGRCMLLFTARDGDTAPGYVSCIQFRNYAMTAEEVAVLGGPTAEGIPLMEPILEDENSTSTKNAQ